MAQLVERLVRNEEASGSNPLISTTQGTVNSRPFFCVVEISVRSVRCIISGSCERANSAEQRKRREACFASDTLALPTSAYLQ